VASPTPTHAEVKAVTSAVPANTGRCGSDGRLEAVLDGIAVGWAYEHPRSVLCAGVCPVTEGMRHLPLGERDMTVDVSEIDEVLRRLLRPVPTNWL
jgi:hypothetical protein